VKSNDHLLDAGLELMLAGMGTVFLFLTLLILATMLMSGLVQRFLPVAPPADTAPGSSPSAAELAAISAAIHQHRLPGNKTKG